MNAPPTLESRALGAYLGLAIGDALSVALLEAKGFTAVDFRTFHPGGKLGAVLLLFGKLKRA